MMRTRSALLLTVLLFSVPTFAKDFGFADVPSLRAEMSLRFDRTESLNTASSDWNSAELGFQINALVENYRQQVSQFTSNSSSNSSASEIDYAKRSLAKIFSLLPKSDLGFAKLLPLRPRTAPTLVRILRTAMSNALRISSAQSELRAESLRLLSEQMNAHGALARGRLGPQFLSTFSIWTNVITGWRLELADARTHPTTRETLKDFAKTVSPSETEQMRLNDLSYAGHYGTMMCPRLFEAAR